ncbi:MAG: prepilin-type N-terminal cleavage/methylation domain-containing protein [Candidatus Paceibacterota bacterium]|jgi:prepilin-type N-terminal cleavage/methylation domain-containing protein
MIIKKETFSNLKGFTLMEIIIYIAILGIVMYFVGGFALNAISNRDKIQNSQDINDNGRFMMTTISDQIQSADSINGAVTQ